jgi:ATP-dependent Clp protease ATP-binding subunit ClpC
MALELTPRCRRVIENAKESLPRLGHTKVSSAHLVLGLIALKGGVAANVLLASDETIPVVESYLATRNDSSDESVVYAGAVLAKTAITAFERAEVEACVCQHTYLGTEHLLLGILVEEKGEAADLFALLGVDREEIKRIVVKEIR